MSFTDKMKVKRNIEYVYLLQEREFLQSNVPIYKIGRTAQENTKRATQYPKDSVLHLHTSCSDSVKVEKELLNYFKQKYIHRKDIGNEYFEGDFELMKNDINKIISPKWIELVECKNVLSNDIIVHDSDETQYLKEEDDKNSNNAKEGLESKKKYNCTLCLYKTDKCCNMKSHLISDKHKFKLWQSLDKNSYKCKCGKIFKHNPSLSRHKKSCVLHLKMKEKIPSLLSETIL